MYLSDGTKTTALTWTSCVERDSAESRSLCPPRGGEPEHRPRPFPRVNGRLSREAQGAGGEARWVRGRQGAAAPERVQVQAEPGRCSCFRGALGGKGAGLSLAPASAHAPRGPERAVQLLIHPLSKQPRGICFVLPRSRPHPHRHPLLSTSQSAVSRAPTTCQALWQGLGYRWTG